MDSYDDTICTTLTVEGRQCRKPAGAGVGGFNGWCRDHFEEISRNLARYVTVKTRDAAFAWTVGKILSYAARHFPLRIFNSAMPGALTAMEAEATLQHQGIILDRRLHAPLGPHDRERLLHEAEEWWRAIPAEAREAARAWAERSNP